MHQAPREKLTRFLAVLRLAAPDSTDVVRRVLPLERNIALPARIAVILILFHSLYFSPWIGWVSSSLEVGVETVTSLYWVYAAASTVLSCALLLARHMPTTLVRWTVISMWLLDAVFLAGLTLITGGYDSFAYWLFVVLIIRTVLIEPASTTQFIVNLFTTGCYVVAGLTDFALAAGLDEDSRLLLGLTPASSPGEVLFVRAMLLELVAVCGFGAQLLLERQHRAEVEAREHRLREDQLRSTGRLAAEIAHQLKNPLAIINNTTFSLQRALGNDLQDASRFTHIIREEIERADRILTQVMGYARLAEGRIEKVDVVTTLEAVIEEVFPKDADFDVLIQRFYQPDVPPLTMQRAHLREMLVNLLTNARDATSGPGLVQVRVRCLEGNSVEVLVADNGPGIPRDQLQRVFEAYYTTKPKGTGLGLAIVRNTAELYGGTVQVESELGKGARFRLTFPLKVSNLSQA